jgi:signal recognition particle receptor subunit beta
MAPWLPSKSSLPYTRPTTKVFLRELIPILTTLCARAHSNPSAPPPHLLILANKSDLLTKPSQSTSTAPSDTKTRTLAHDRLITLLTRELDRAKASRASTTGRIDAIDHIPSASTTSFSPITWIKRFFGGAAAPTAGTTADESWAVERAEEALWGGRGDGFRFEDVEGVDVEFGVGSAVRGKEGLEEVWDWLSGL